MEFGGNTPVRVFISFKNSDISGAPTRDSQIANALYNELTGRGVETFFSSSTLLTLGQSVYKRAIDEALEHAQVMVVIATNEAFLSSQWVRYEWESFHQDILSGMKPNAQIIPYLGHISREETPRSLRDFQTFLTDTHSVSQVADFVEQALNARQAASPAQPRGFSQDQIDQTRQSLSSKKVRQSLYASDTDKEFDRLRIQSRNTQACDMSVLNRLMKEIPRSPLWILDIGCAYNFVGNMRFKNLENVRVLGVDISEKCLNYAAETSDPEKFTFRKLDLEDPDMEYTLRGIMDELGIEKFDIMFGALVFHHLKKPITALKKLRRFLAGDGYIIVRGSDDGSVMAVNDDGLVQKIVEKCINTVGVSDRRNGRKLFNQLEAAGYRNVKLETFLKDIGGIDIDDRDDIYFERFSYRINYFRKIMEADPHNEAKRNDYLFMKYALEELEEMFSNHDFWYCEHDFIAYATR